MIDAAGQIWGKKGSQQMVGHFWAATKPRHRVYKKQHMMDYYFVAKNFSKFNFIDTGI